MTKEGLKIRRPLKTNGPPETWNFYDLRGDQPKNELDSNLTELYAATQYIDHGYAGHRDWLGHMSRFMSFARKVKAHKSRILDVGCGKFSLPYLLNQNRRAPAEYWGLDLRATEKWGTLLNWRAATNLVRMDLILDDPAEIKTWPTEGFDLVACFETLEHVPVATQPVLIQNLFAWTAPGGLCYFSTPNHGGSVSVAKNHLGPDGEIRERTYGDKIALCLDAGFRIIDTFGVFIRMDRIPKEAWDNPVVQAADRMLGRDWFSMLMAPAYPEESNNSMFILQRPE